MHLQQGTGVAAARFAIRGLGFMNRKKVLDRSHQTLYSQIANIWRDRILSGEFKPGDVLPSEREIAAELEVSRIPVREAMKSLEYLGVVRQQRGRGVVVQEADLGNALKVVGPLVTTITPDILENLFDFRILIEPYAAEQAALYATESELQAIKEAVDTQRQAYLNTEKAENVSFDFHYRVLMASHNEIIAIVSRFLSEVQHYSRHMTLWNEERRKTAFADHFAIYEAIAARKPELARETMKRHLYEAKDVLPTVPAASADD